MQGKRYILLKCLVLACLMPTLVDCQVTGVAARSSLGVHGGYFFTRGSWSTSRVAPDVTMFGGNYSGDVDLEFPVDANWTFAFIGGYAELDGSSWENYSRARGDEVRVSAAMTHVGILLRPHIRVSPDDLVKLELGVAGLFTNGTETVDGQVYGYDFFKSFALGGRGGVEYDRVLHRNFAVCCRLTGMMFPSGVKYVDGETRTIVALPLTVGIRFLL